MSLDVCEGMLCLCCQQPIDAGAGSACPTCGAPHHTACWDRTGGCSSPKCANRRPIGLPEQTVPPPPPVFGIQGAPNLGYRAVELGIGPVFSVGWAQFSRYLGPMLLGVFLFELFSLVLGVIPYLGACASLFILPQIQGGVTILSLRAMNDHDPQAGDIFAGFQQYWDWLGLSLLWGLINLACVLPALAAFFLYMAKTLSPTAAGGQVSSYLATFWPAMIGCSLLWLLCAVPILTRLMFSYFLMAEGYGIVNSLRESWIMTRGRGLQLFGIGLVILLLLLSGFLAFGIGVLFTSPLALSIFAALYNAVKTEREPVTIGQLQLR